MSCLRRQPVAIPMDTRQDQSNRRSFPRECPAPSRHSAARTPPPPPRGLGVRGVRGPRSSSTRPAASSRSTLHPDPRPGHTPTTHAHHLPPPPAAGAARRAPPAATTSGPPPPTWPSARPARAAPADLCYHQFPLQDGGRSSSTSTSCAPPPPPAGPAPSSNSVAPTSRSTAPPAATPTTLRASARASSPACTRSARECLQILYESCPKYKFISCPTCRPRDRPLHRLRPGGAGHQHQHPPARLPTDSGSAMQWGRGPRPQLLPDGASVLPVRLPPAT
ncbi:hypothetical protein SKAU_G00355680 [Synaphobranchus kaupii]|uniref:Uncharacterized protein n=1 Tax=Synaphobranchus kaupii TaxID=118154 RepID=A0A9Q1EHD1_SYNKA|nr:hypothetical protein SKAU_G00355680 [Synaphobranchus kaupii]